MSKFTTTSLIEFLKEFPEDLPIETELALMWNYDDEFIETGDYNDEELEKYSRRHATDLCIFEGSWETGNVSDVDGLFKKFQEIKETE